MNRTRHQRLDSFNVKTFTKLHVATDLMENKNEILQLKKTFNFELTKERVEPPTQNLCHTMCFFNVHIVCKFQYFIHIFTVLKLENKSSKTNIRIVIVIWNHQLSIRLQLNERLSPCLHLSISFPTLLSYLTFFFSFLNFILEPTLPPTHSTEFKVVKSNQQFSNCQSRTTSPAPSISSSSSSSTN